MAKEEPRLFAPCSPEQRKLLMDETTDVILTGGSAGGGKSRMCLTKYLSYLSDPNFRGIVFRRSRPEIFASGSLVDESHQIYPFFGGIWKSQAARWHFPSGATLQFAAIGDDRDLPSWQGSALTNILIDEAADGWTEKQFLFLMTRLRSATFKGKMQVLLSCNPNQTSFLYPYVQPLLDEAKGTPKEGTEDIVRWFVVVSDKVRWGDTPEQLYEEYGKGKTLGKDFMPKSFRFIPLSIFSNKILLKNNPGYLANLMAQPMSNQLRFLYGSWTSVPDGGAYWKSTWTEGQLVSPSDLPQDITWVRFWDLGSSEPSTALPNPDWTVGVKIGKSKGSGNYYVSDVARFRKNLPGVMDEIVRIAFIDGVEECTVGIPRDPGAGGKFASQYMVKELADRGVPVKIEVVSGHSSKLSKFLPFCSVSEAKAVFYVKADWNEDFFAELSQFSGGSRMQKDDQVDSVSSGFRALARANTLPTFTLGNDSYTRSSPLG